LSTVTPSTVSKSFDPCVQVGGKSGCQIELIESEGITVLRKYASTAEYSPRLRRQAGKQRAFAQLSDAAEFRTPRVIDVRTHTDASRSYIDMEYVHAEKYSTFLAHVSAVRLITFADGLIRYFDDAIHRSSSIDLNRGLLHDKLEAVTSQLPSCVAQEPILMDTRRILGSPPTGQLLHGRCHGDFTLSNMLFHADRVYLIDFLDSFVETPLHDVVKLRQDTHFGWSLMLEPDLPSYQRHRVLQALRFIDGRVDRWLSNKPDIAEWCNYFQVFNLYRILPYLSKPAELSFVQNALKQALKACN